jgi:four helix bundle protein
MARKFEDIEVWQLARDLVSDVYSLTGQEKIRKNNSLSDQIQRAALSVMNNIAEGFERYSYKEFSYLLNVSKGSVGEVRSMLYVLLDMKLIEDSQFQNLQEKAFKISKSLAGFIGYLKNSNSDSDPVKRKM